MKLALLGKKLGMTQVYDSNNCLVPVTVIQAGPCPVTQVKTVEKDGYNAIQIGLVTSKVKNLSKGEQGHLSRANGAEATLLREIRLTEEPTQKAGESLDVTLFADAAKVDIIGVTKGRGFQGVVKRFRTRGGPASHGSMFHRRIGSIGQCQYPGHVNKNQKMPGHMGSRNRTVQNLRVVQVDAEKNLILVRGAVPGANGDTVLVRAAKKVRTSPTQA